MSSDQLMPEDSISDLVKESQVHLLQLHAMETATQLMVEDFTIFRQIGEKVCSNSSVSFLFDHSCYLQLFSMFQFNFFPCFFPYPTYSTLSFDYVYHYFYLSRLFPSVFIEAEESNPI